MRILIKSLKTLLISISLILSQTAKADNVDPWEYCAQCSEKLEDATRELKVCNETKKINEWYQEPEVMAALVIASVFIGIEINKNFGNTKVFNQGLRIEF